MCGPVLEKGERRFVSATAPTARTWSYAAGYSTGLPWACSLPIAVPHRRHPGDPAPPAPLEQQLPRLRRLRPTERQVEHLGARRRDGVESPQESRAVNVEVALVRLVGKDLPHRDATPGDADDTGRI